MRNLKGQETNKQTTTSTEMLCTLQVLVSVKHPKPPPTDAIQIYNAGRKAHVTRMDSAHHTGQYVHHSPLWRQRWSTPGLHTQTSTSVQGTRKGLQLGCFYSRPLPVQNSSRPSSALLTNARRKGCWPPHTGCCCCFAAAATGFLKT